MIERFREWLRSVVRESIDGHVHDEEQELVAIRSHLLLLTKNIAQNRVVLWWLIILALIAVAIAGFSVESNYHLDQEADRRQAARLAEHVEIQGLITNIEQVLCDYIDLRVGADIPPSIRDVCDPPAEP